MEPSGPGESSARGPSRRRLLLWATAGSVVVLLALTVLLVLRQDGRQQADLPVDRSTDAVTDRADATRDLLADLESALSAGDPEAAAVLADPDVPEAEAELRALARNVRRLDLAILRLRYVDDLGRTGDGHAAWEVREDTWTAAVAVSWQLEGVHDGESTADVPVRLGWSEERSAHFVAVDQSRGARMPLWLQGPVDVRRGAQWLAITAREDADVLGRQLETAVRTVRRTLDDWRGSLVVEAPRTSDQFEAAAGMARAEAASIAAVTTTTDGASAPPRQVQVYLNPTVFDPLGPAARQIVLSHETTHVAVDALTLATPPWLSEGFADYVALTDTRLPRTTLAAQILDLVRSDGPPRTLPGRAQFGGSDDDLGAWYEAAWLAVDLIAQEHGEDRLLDFFERVGRTGDAGDAFRRVLGVSEDEFVVGWRAYLTDLAAA